MGMSNENLFFSTVSLLLLNTRVQIPVIWLRISALEAALAKKMFSCPAGTIAAASGASGPMLKNMTLIEGGTLLKYALMLSTP